ncbi:sterol desaturase family protein [Streptomyces sp. ISL-100]|uniref:sterol desaturase family protein n=1 Tax=Streptomyces sp. ISL-100 TaxID=2819173 RepID=UPI0020361D99|nr:sterol desaturase family protein [Streptomyces sp. ISL-100]
MSSSSTSGAVLARVAHPLLLLSVVAVFAATVRYSWEPGRVTFLFQLATLGALVVLESLIPYEPAWRPDRREWRWYAVYYALTAVGGALGSALVVFAVGLLARPDSILPLGAEIPLALLLGSLAGYGFHRLGHTNPWLWRLHGVHHVPEKVNVGNNGVNHIGDILLSQAIVQLALALVGFSDTAVFGVGLFVVAQGYLIHANVAVRLGPLNHVFASPEQHRLHHSADLAEAGHYGADLSIWDRAFGSFTWHPGREPAAVGLADPDSFPGTGAIVATLVHPLRRRSVRTGETPG